MGTIEMTFGSAIRQALREEMSRDPDVFLLGEDIGKYGGAFKVTMALIDEFGPERVIDTPISEAAIVGVALGAALMGKRPVAEIMYMDFLQLAMEQLVTQAARARFLSGGKLEVPMTVRTQYSLGRTYGPQHTQFFPSWFFQAPGLYVALPSTPADAKGLLKSAIRGRNPVLFIECGALYTTSGPVPEEEYLTPFGKASVKRSGNHVTLVAFSRVVLEALKAAEELSEEGINVEVIDPLTIQPLDKETIVNSVRKTHRLVLASDDFAIGGVGSAVVSAILEDVFYELEAPIKIVGSPPFPAPSNYVLEQQYMINKEKIKEAIRDVVSA